MISGRALVGVTLNGRYEILTRVHTGAVATVYYGRDLHAGRPVAVKVVSQHEFGKRHDAVLRFHRETTLLTQIRHPNIIETYDRGETPYGVAYFVMPWLEGRTLLEELDEHGQLPLKRIQTVFRPVCEAVAVIHAAGVVHRDIKPGNIFLSRNADGREHVTLLDFGVAKPVFGAFADDVEISGEHLTVGTPEYMSPEQCGEQPLTPAGDIYSLGVLLYRMLAGRPPFIGPSPYVMARHIAAEPPPLHLRRPHLPEAVVSVVARAMRKDPQERFPSAADLCAAFDAAVAGADEDVRYLRPQPPETDEAGARYRTRKMAAVNVAGQAGAADGAEANRRA